MVRINFKVAFAFKVQIKAGPETHQGKHVIGKPYSGIDRGKALTIDIQFQGDISFLGATGN
jgi:hypothetical protein